MVSKRGIFMSLSRFFILVFSFVLSFSTIVVAGTNEIQLKCSTTITRSSGSDQTLLTDWTPVSEFGCEGGSVAFDYQGQPDRCRVEGEIYVRVSNTCETATVYFPNESGQIAFIVDYDEPEISDYTSFTTCNAPYTNCYYCKSANANTKCIKSQDKIVDTNYNEKLVYWDRLYTSEDAPDTYPGECCGDDFDTNTTKDGYPYIPQEADDPDNSIGFCNGGNSDPPEPGCPMGNFNSKIGIDGSTQDGIGNPKLRDWHSTYGCCGDDYLDFIADYAQSDLRLHSNKHLCFHTTDLYRDFDDDNNPYFYPRQDQWYWIYSDSENVRGGVVYVIDMDGCENDISGCTETVYYADDDGTWQTCNPGDGEEYITANGKRHEYVCYGDTGGKPVMAECCSTTSGSASELGKRSNCHSIVTYEDYPENFGKTKGIIFARGTRHEIGSDLDINDDGSVDYYCVAGASSGDTEWMTQTQLENGELNDANSCNQIEANSWTGTRCCLDVMASVYYSDETGGKGEACWLGDVVEDGDLVDNSKILNDDGQLRYCSAGPSDPNPYTNGEVLQNDICETEGGHFCNISGKWVSNPPEDRSWLSGNVPGGNPDDQACCIPGDCWGGPVVALGYPIDNPPYGCVPNQSQDPHGSPIPDQDGMRCIDGEWRPPIEKYTQYLDFGYCTSHDQCLFNEVPCSTSCNLRCVEPGFYYKDYYCDNGNWTTRTSLLARELIKLGGGQTSPFTLVCGNAFEVLNYLMDTTIGGTEVWKEEIFDCEEYADGNDLVCNNPLADPRECFNKPANINKYLCANVNNFCIVDLDNTGNIVIATTINKDIEGNIDPNLGKVLAALDLDQDYCDNVVGDDFGQCVSPNVYYNPLTASIVYYKHGHGFNFGGEPLTWLTDLIKGIISWVQGTKDEWLIYGEYFTFVDIPQKLDKLYIRNEPQNSRGIYGVMETVGVRIGSFRRRPFFSIKYMGFDKDICAMVSLYDNRTSYGEIDKELERLICRQLSPTDYEVLGGSHANDVWPVEPENQREFWLEMDVWHDLTMKLE
jgi:hypothetical protein